MPWIPPRSHDPEIMDAPGLPESEIERAYRELARVNRQLGNRIVLEREVRRALKDEEPAGGGSARLLDLGTGGGDLLSGLARRLNVGVLGVDRDPVAARLGQRAGLAIVRADALRLPLADSTFDVVLAVKFAHHFHGRGLERLLAEMARVARRRVIVLDIRRHRLAYWGFLAWARLTGAGRVVRSDGALSVLRGFTRSELLDLGSTVPGWTWTVRTYPGFQIVLTGRRQSSQDAHPLPLGPETS